MSNHGYAVILLPSTNHAMRAETLLLSAGLTFKLIPVPRQIASDCGVCIRIRRQDIETAQRIITEGAIVIEAIKEI